MGNYFVLCWDLVSSCVRSSKAAQFYSLILSFFSPQHVHVDLAPLVQILAHQVTEGQAFAFCSVVPQQGVELPRLAGHQALKRMWRETPDGTDSTRHSEWELSSKINGLAGNKRC